MGGLPSFDFWIAAHGGTSMEREILFWEMEEHMITEVTAEDVYEFTFNAGDNFIVLKGDDFTYSIEYSEKGNR